MDGLLVSDLVVREMIILLKGKTGQMMRCTVPPATYFEKTFQSTLSLTFLSTIASVSLVRSISVHQILFFPLTGWFSAGHHDRHFPVSEKKQKVRDGDEGQKIDHNFKSPSVSSVCRKVKPKFNHAA